MLKQQKQSPSGTIILDNPGNRNALSRAMVAELVQAFADFHREKTVRAIILTASGAVFCSGVDLKEWKKIAEENEPFEQWQEIASELQELIEVMLRFPKPIIAAMDGPVFGMGMALALASDLVIASPNCRFELPSAKHGQISGLVAPLLSFRCGAGVASRMLLGEPLDVSEAHRLGIVHHVVASELIWAKANEWVGQIAAGAAESIQLSKRLLNEMIGESLFTQLFSGAAMMATACSTEASKEGLQAFAEKRAPKFL
jgi:methylglutaconyl-CoA hydratase